MVTPPFLMQA
jgi:DNA topoisomerase III